MRKIVELDADKKDIALKRLKDIYNTTIELYSSINDDDLREDMRDVLFSLIESYTSEASKVIGYNSNATKAINERYADVRKANAKIAELESKLANNTPVDGMSMLMMNLSDTLKDWWHSQGFNHITEEKFNFYGYRAEFCTSLDRISSFTMTPVTDKEIQKIRHVEMAEEYEFYNDTHDGLLLVDNEFNRKKITDVIQSKFKSAEIISWKNWNIRKTDKFQLRSFEVIIRDLAEIKALKG